jgi:hypothetical protein
MAKKAVFGIYGNRTALETGLSRLRDAGFANSDVAILIPQADGEREIGTEMSSKAPEGAAAGAGTGAVMGGVLGWLAGVGTFALPGIGPLIAAGPIVGALAGAGVGGTVGGVAGALLGLGIPEYEAKRYEGGLKQGKTLLSVHCEASEEIDRAKAILESTGAEDISSTSESSVKSAGVGR